MNVVVSGQAGFALLFEGKRIYSIHRENPGELVPRHPGALRLLLSGVQDLEVYDKVDQKRAEAELTLATRRADALQIALMLLDPSLSDGLRIEAAEELETLLADESVAGYVRGVLWSHPLPPDGDLESAIGLIGGSPSRAFQLLSDFEREQPWIQAAWTAWTGIPEEVFDEPEQRNFARAMAVRRGLFPILVKALSEGQSATELSLLLLGSPQARSVPNFRHVCQAWLTSFQANEISPNLSTHRTFSAEEIEESDVEGPLPTTRLPAQEALALVERRKAAILEAMQRRDLGKAGEYVEELITAHLRDKHGSEYASKSLCHLAMEAKRLGETRFQLELTSRAVSLEPSDGWAWCQQGDALKAASRFEDALHAYQLALDFGHREVGLTGRADVLKALNRLPEAFDAYQDACRNFPSDAFARTGRAEVLKALNRLPEALDAYQDACRDFPENVVARTGRAEVLKALNRLPEALDAYQDSCRDFPGEVVARNGRAEVLKALNRLPEALDAYQDACRDFPGDVVTRNGRAEVLKALNRLPEALDAYGDACRDFPESVVARCGRAEVLKALNRLPEALGAYQEACRDFPEDVVARNGRAEILKALNRLPEALDAYQETCRDFPGDAFARTGRAEVLKALNRLPEALDSYQETCQDFPESVVAHAGRAEALRALNRLSEALAAYDETAQRFPNDLVTRYGRANVLSSLGRFEEALLLLPAEAPARLVDWVGYHIRGMVLLRTGRFDDATKVFSSGAFSPLPAEHLSYFKTALAVCYLREHRYRDATAILTEELVPSLKDRANVLLFHAHGALGNHEQAEEIERALSERSEPEVLVDLRNEIGRRYLGRQTPLHSENWLIEKEVELLAA